MMKEKEAAAVPPADPLAAAETETLKDQLLRLQADFENARRRWRQEQAQVQERANADLLRELLEIYDDFQRALAANPVRPEQAVHPSTLRQAQGRPAQDERRVEGPDQFIAGVEMIAQRMESFLKGYGIQPIEAEGKPFDPALHEAVTHEVSESVPEGTVLSELRRGYTMNGRVLRTAVVKVSSQPEKEEGARINPGT